MSDNNTNNNTTKNPENSILSPKILGSFATVILALGSFSAWYAYSNYVANNQINNPDKNGQTTPDTPINNNKTQVQIYGLDDQLAIVPTIIETENSQNEQELLTVAFNKLLTGWDAKNITTAIPEGTKLLSLNLKEDGIHIDLSPEFTSGGGSQSMIGRLGQIVYTASSLNPSVNIWINVNGQPLDILGEEGLMVDQPMTREIFKQSFENP